MSPEGRLKCTHYIPDTKWAQEDSRKAPITTPLSLPPASFQLNLALKNQCSLPGDAEKALEDS